MIFKSYNREVPVVQKAAIALCGKCSIFASFLHDFWGKSKNLPSASAGAVEIPKKAKMGLTPGYKKHGAETFRGGLYKVVGGRTAPRLRPLFELAEFLGYTTMVPSKNGGI